MKKTIFYESRKSALITLILKNVLPIVLISTFMRHDSFGMTLVTYIFLYAAVSNTVFWTKFMGGIKGFFFSFAMLYIHLIPIGIIGEITERISKDFSEKAIVTVPAVITIICDIPIYMAIFGHVAISESFRPAEEEYSPKTVLPKFSYEEVSAPLPEKQITKPEFFSFDSLVTKPEGALPEENPLKGKFIPE